MNKVKFEDWLKIVAHRNNERRLKDLQDKANEERNIQLLFNKRCKSKISFESWIEDKDFTHKDQIMRLANLLVNFTYFL